LSRIGATRHELPYWTGGADHGSEGAWASRRRVRGAATPTCRPPRPEPSSPRSWTARATARS